MVGVSVSDCVQLPNQNDRLQLLTNPSSLVTFNLKRGGLRRSVGHQSPVKWIDPERNTRGVKFQGEERKWKEGRQGGRGGLVAYNQATESRKNDFKVKKLFEIVISIDAAHRTW